MERARIRGLSYVEEMTIALLVIGAHLLDNNLWMFIHGRGLSILRERGQDACVYRTIRSALHADNIAVDGRTVGVGTASVQVGPAAGNVGVIMASFSKGGLEERTADMLKRRGSVL